MLKDILLGAAVQLIPKSISHFAFNYMERVQGVPSEELRANPWYMEILGPAFPPVDDIILDLGLPAILYGASMATIRRKEMLKHMALGAGLTGVATFIHDVIGRSAVLLTPTP
ncbi:unnamed protein product [marine sediment metagenome]|uniref:Uncharacterized protein n=1 Tax=marine sediment metagenome TaxID=412755 RepID=X1RJF0_9ZZZZ